MRELAIHAANEGFNDADQLAADQAEIANAISTIDRIAPTRSSVPRSFLMVPRTTLLPLHQQTLPV